jgi:hypothetical protein
MKKFILLSVLSTSVLAFDQSLVYGHRNGECFTREFYGDTWFDAKRSCNSAGMNVCSDTRITISHSYSVAILQCEGVAVRSFGNGGCGLNMSEAESYARSAALNKCNAEASRGCGSKNYYCRIDG